MREVSGTRRSAKKRKKKKKCGCGGCLGKFILFAVIASLIGVVGVRLFNQYKIGDKIMQKQYPITYQSIVEKYAKEYKLEPSLVFAIIRTESKFDANAVSKNAAYGLMQLREETGLDCSKKLNIKNFKKEDLMNPEINIRMGCCYFRSLLNRYRNNTRNAIAAYNSGPGNVDKWLKDKTCIDADGNLVNIPFSETKDYVKKVSTAYYQYKKLYYTQD